MRNKAFLAVLLLGMSQTVSGCLGAGMMAAQMIPTAITFAGAAATAQPSR